MLQDVGIDVKVALDNGLTSTAAAAASSTCAGVHTSSQAWSAGQGLNIALEDGAVLAAHVQENGLSPATLRAFEKERVPRVATIVRQEEVLHPAF